MGHGIFFRFSNNVTMVTRNFHMKSIFRATPDKPQCTKTILKSLMIFHNFDVTFVVILKHCVSVKCIREINLVLMGSVPIVARVL